MTHTDIAIRALAAALATEAPELRALYIEAMEVVAKIARAELMAQLQMSAIDAPEMRH